eukprot:TRINITY_DN7425_c0_g1_i1.p1 TRINITY_DN7425_c0_g1~~TRINITY_DN7425_c0_g1_i1.p1  ORF type:complete len:432 (-),score=79.51 TRINITY_DN7425_c0_g1_i1:78-1289(-)
MHVRDTNTNIVSLVSGPSKFTCLENHEVILSPTKMILIPPCHYAIIDNPVQRTRDPKTGELTEEVQFETNGQVVLRHGDQEVRFHQKPFPLYDGEVCGKIYPLQVVQEDTALLLQAKRSFFDVQENVERRSGERWLFRGRKTYYPQVGVEVVKTITPVLLNPDQALQVKAVGDCVDFQGKKRKLGEEWLVMGRGVYLPDVNEQVESTLSAHVLTDTKAIHVRAKAPCKDYFGFPRKAGEEWLVTKQQSRTYIPGVNETLINTVNLVILTSTQFVVLNDPVDSETQQRCLGRSKIIRGPGSFFLQPGESIQGDVVQECTVLSPNEALWLQAKQSFKDETGRKRKPGEEWLVCGPLAYWPPLEVSVQKKVKAFLFYEPIGVYFFRAGFFLFNLFVLVLGTFLFLF